MQQDIPFSQTALDEVLTAREAEGHADSGPGAWEQRLHESQNEFAGLMTALEAEDYKMGYRFAAAFAGGDCELSDACAGATAEQ